MSGRAMSDTLTASQARVLRFLASYPIWHALLSLDRIRLLREDDVLCVPSLVESGWVQHQVILAAVRISPSGRIKAEMIPDD
jgi:ribosomal protein L18E